jgi:2-C-methyl-D-erythritol 4-phosphate cytidylyltransferase
MPAAGRGERLGAGLPKQYLTLLGRPMLEWSLAPFLADADCRGVVVAVAAGDMHWSALRPRLSRPVREATGGATRADSVASGLAALRAARAQDDDWVLVHDAARPCVTAAEIDALRAAVVADPRASGGLLAVPLSDTLKRGDAAHGATRSEGTLPRESLWRALTPQMFRLGALEAALVAAAREGRSPTDEAQAVEWQGGAPRLVAGEATNLKVTTQADVTLAEAILASRSQVPRAAPAVIGTAAVAAGAGARA